MLVIITYGSEVWISDFKSNFDTLDNIQFEKTQNVILKNILGVHGKSSNLATRCELGTLPIKIKCYNLMFRYYTRFREIDGQPGGQYDTQALVSFKKYMPPLPYFKVNICPFPLPHFASIFFAYL